ncbi:hypothetical protein E4U10_006731 [Claviceps purpurea]|nr:hypothetical protein E4U10_006731 [Claviceps purpurea]
MDDNSIPVQVLVLTRDTGWYCQVGQESLERFQGILQRDEAVASLREREITLFEIEYGLTIEKASKTLPQRTIDEK